MKLISNVDEEPAQIVEAPLMVAVGIGFTNIVALPVNVPAQPAALTAVIEYVAELDGVTVIVVGVAVAVPAVDVLPSE